MLHLSALPRGSAAFGVPVGPRSMIAITSRRNASVARYLAAVRGEDRSVVLLDGLHLVGEALSAGTPVQHALVAADAQQSPDVREIIRRLLDTGVIVASASAAVMSAVSPVRSRSPVVALARRPESGPRVFARRTRPVVIACDIQDPGNVGAVIRSAAAAQPIDRTLLALRRRATDGDRLDGDARVGGFGYQVPAVEQHHRPAAAGQRAELLHDRMVTAGDHG